ncbi:MAG: hypothetical protein Q8Q03_00755 [bacterium]|nr:hypothetical protein [bacterium]
MKNGSIKQAVAVILALVILAGIYYFSRSDDLTAPVGQNAVSSDQVSNESSSPLTQQEAEELVLNEWGGCTPDSCGSFNVTVSSAGNQTIVTAIYGQMRDDSISAAKNETVAVYKDGSWTLGEPKGTFSCQKGRGHEDFSDVPCI